MKGSEFVQKYAGAGQRGWEAAAVDLARSGDSIQLVYVPVPVEGGSHQGTVYVSSDVFTIGEPGDFIRLPLSPGAAQAVANLLGGALLPTKKLSSDINRNAPVRLQPRPLPNKEANLAQFAEHSQIVDAQIAQAGATAGALITGAKKDVLVSNKTKPGRVMIYGWFGTYAGQPQDAVYTDKYGAKYIQPLSDVHGDYYADYSHGIRFVAPTMVVDGAEMRTEDVYRSPSLSVLVSDEGPLQNPRYPTSVLPSGGGGSSPGQGTSANLGIYLQGLMTEVALSPLRGI